MNDAELKKEQCKLAEKVLLHPVVVQPKTIGAALCVQYTANSLLACVIVCDCASLTIKKQQTFVLNDPLPHSPGLIAYREMPALIEAYNKLKLEPDVLLVAGTGILHQRKLGIASHLGLLLNKSTIGVTDKLIVGMVKENKVFNYQEQAGWVMQTKEYANPIYISPGHLMNLDLSLEIISKLIRPPHKMPEPLHLANKIARKKIRESEE